MLRFTRARPRNARRDAEPPHGGLDGHPHRAHRRADLRARLRHRRHRRRGAVADRQCQPQSRPGLHHRQLHGRGVRRRRQSLGHAGRRLHARHRQQVPRAVSPAPCSARSRSWCSSSCSSRSGRAACSRSRAGRWRHDRRARSSAALDRGATIFVLVLVADRRRSCRCSTCCCRRARSSHVPTYLVALLGKYVCYAHARALDRSDLGLLRHPLARPRRVLRARRLRHGHVPDAPDRHARRLRQSDPAGLHGVPELAGAAVVLVRLRHLLRSRR